MHRIVTSFDHHCSYQNMNLPSFGLRALVSFMIWDPDNVDGFHYYVLAFLSNNANTPWPNNKASGIHVTSWPRALSLSLVAIIWTWFERVFVNELRNIISMHITCYTRAYLWQPNIYYNENFRWVFPIIDITISDWLEYVIVSMFHKGYFPIATLLDLCFRNSWQFSYRNYTAFP